MQNFIRFFIYLQDIKHLERTAPISHDIRSFSKRRECFVQGIKSNKLVFTYNL